MPQCIAQQDQSTWLKAMTKCSWKRCTRHFWFICTQHQWFTQTSCLNTELSADTMNKYYPYCSRSILAKAQLYEWIRRVTGRLFLLSPGDANGLRSLSPASLELGYKTVSTTDDAPTCLVNSRSTFSEDSFQRIMKSCSFESVTRHTGNAARPWEFRENVGSIAALDSEIVGYPSNFWDHLWNRLEDSTYFDRACFCHVFGFNMTLEPCANPNTLEMTKERLWMSATCGHESMPDDWKAGLRLTGDQFIPVEDWHWPACINDFPRTVVGLKDQCATQACAVDVGGYCNVKRSIDRACFCRQVSYKSCNGSCHAFEGRLDFVYWLHNTCSGFEDWNGLPNDWTRLAQPTTFDLIPWQWKLQPSTLDSPSNSSSSDTVQRCASNKTKIYSLLLINICTIFAVFIWSKVSLRNIMPNLVGLPHSGNPLLIGSSIIALQFIASAANALVVRTLPEYDEVSFWDLIGLWCTIPRPVWAVILHLSARPLSAHTLATSAATMLSEAVLQLLGSFYLIQTVYYGLEHNLYFGHIRAAQGDWATLMYGGALVWVLVMGVSIALIMKACITSQEKGDALPRNARNLFETFEDAFTQKSTNSKDATEETFLFNSNGRYHTSYGTLPANVRVVKVAQKAFFTPYKIAILVTLFLWIAQCAFWAGFIGLSSEMYVFGDISNDNS